MLFKNASFTEYEQPNVSDIIGKKPDGHGFEIR
jgi:hypothetical protein